MLRLILLIFLLLHAPTAGAAETLKVAFYPLDGFFEYDEYGRECGYGVDYLNKIADYTGYSFEYVKADAWEETWKMLLDGRVDLRMPVENSNKRPPTMAMTVDPILRTFYTVLALKSREDLNYNDFEQLKTIPLAISEKMWRHDDIEAEFSALGIDKHLLFFSEYNDCRKALENGIVDGIITNVMDMTDDTKMLARFRIMPTHISMRKDDKRLAVISDAITNIKLNEPSFEAELYKKYFPNRANAPFTKEEKAFINNHKKLTVAMFADRKPMSFRDASGKMQGLAVDMLELVAQKTGLSFTVVPIAFGTNPLTELNNPAVDLVLPIPDRNHLKMKADITVTKSLFSTPLLFVARQGASPTMNDAVTIAVLKDNTGIVRTALEAFPLGTVTLFNNLESCLAAVRDNKAQVCLHTLYPLDYELQRARNRSLASIPPMTASIPCALGGKSDLPPELFSILQKGIERITPEERESVIRNSLTKNRYEPTFADRIQENIWPLGTAAILFWMLFFWTISRIRTLRRLEMANKAKSLFLSRMSHDIRTPMNAIIGLVDLTLDLPDLPDDAKKNLKDVMQSSEYLRGLINDVLDMSKIESGKVSIRPIPTVYADFCAALMPPLQAVAQSKGVTLTWNQSFATPRPIMLDRQHYGQIIVNLISNAIKFTPKGGRIHMGFDKIKSTETELECRLSVSDTGIGISPEFLPYIYEPFRQEDATKTGELKGTGLGLSIVKHLVEQMGGTLAVSSKLGKGTTFTITMSLRFATEKETLTQKPLSTKRQGELKGKRVLLVEDHPMNVLVATKMLEKDEIRIEHATNGQEAVDMFAAHPQGYYDAILMDIRMPVMDGLTASRTIRSLPRADAGSVPIIAMTANAFEEDKQNCFNAGMNAYLTKPIVPQELYATLLEQV